MKCLSFNKRGVFMLLLLLSASFRIWATTPTPSFTYTIQNQVQTSDRTLEFDVYLLNTNSSVVFEAAGVQLGIKISSAILNGGTITPTFLSSYSEMVSAQNPNNMVYDASGPMVKISPRSLPGWGSGTIISTTAPGTRVCRIKLTNSVAFASASADLAHQFSGAPYRSLLSYYDHDTGVVYDFTLNSTNSFTSSANPVINAVAVVTTDAVNASTNVATGTVTDLGSPYPTDHGFAYSSTNNTPTISNSYVSKGAKSTTGSYTAELTSLTAGTSYYVRAYATNSVSTAYGGVLSFTAANLSPSGLSYTTPNVFTKGTLITSLSPTVTGTVTGYSISPSLPTGLAISATTGVISGTPSVVSAATNYTVTATNSYGSTTAVVRITVNDVAPSALSYTTPNVFTKGTLITSLSPTVTGTVTGYSISPSLPTGLAISATTGVISGTPSVVSAATNYTVTATNSGGSITTVVRITVNDVAPSALSYTTPNVFTKGTLITSLSPTVTGTVTGYSISPSLPTGLAISATTGVISGTPSVVSAATNYTVTATNSYGSTTAVVRITVNDVAPSALSYTTPNVFTKGTLITSLSPTVTGTVTGYSISPSLPTGLAISATTGVISGTPSVVSAATNYTVTATNSGGSITAVVRITVNDVAPSALSYTTPNVFTKGTLITSLSPTVTGTVTGYSISPSLPTGLAISATTGVISGTPSVVSAATNYTVTATNSGGSITAALSIEVKDVTPSALSYTTPNVFTKGTLITSLSPTVTGTVTGYSISPSLPTGLAISATTGVISGTPSVVSAATNYTVTATNSGGSITAALSIEVKDVTPSALSYTTPNVFTKGTLITSLSPTVTGTVTGYSISPSLPTGLAISATTGVISGTPSVVSAATNYTVTATNSGGSITAALSIEVKDVTPSALSYTTPNVFTKGTLITSLSPTVTGTVTGYSISPSLPTGLAISATTGVISGTPSVVSAATNYTVTATNSGGSITAVVRITVNDVAPSALSYTTPNVFTKGTLITSLSPTVTGTVTGYSISPSLPTGLAISATTGVISGTPSVVSAATNYTVTATNSGGSITAALSIEVKDVTPSALSYTTPNVFTKSTLITSLSPTVTGAVTGYSISPSLPTGLAISATTGVISGTPSVVSAATNYTVTATNSGGSITAALSIEVKDVTPSALSYTTPNVFTKGTLITSLSPTVTGTVTGYSISPSLPTGLAISATTGVISGTPSVVSAATNYTVTATNSGGSITAALSIEVKDVTPSALSYTTPNVFTKGTLITSLSPTVTGTVTGYSISPSLPTGLAISATTGVISGTPSVVSAATNYTVTATNSGGSITAALSIEVKDVTPSALSYTTPNVFTKGTLITSLSPTVTGTVTGYSISPSLPTGLAISATTGVISGTPSVVSAATNYTVTATNSGGSITAALSIEVKDVTPSALSYTTPNVFTKGTLITSLSPTVTGAVTGYSISPSLPTGLAISATTGVISGTPSVVSTATNYTVTATNSGGSITAALSIEVKDVTPSALSYTTPNVFTKGTLITSLSPTVTGTVTGYSISPSLPTGLAISATTGVISGTPSVVSAATNYTVTATNSGGSITAVVRITVNDVAPSALSYTTPNVFTKGTLITSLSPTVTGTVTGYSISPSLPTGLAISATTGVISGTPSVVSTATNYTVTATNSGGSITAALSIEVKDVTPSALSYTTPNVFTKGTLITSLSPTVTGTVTGYSISPSLPTGLAISATTGVISGTPSVVSAATNYTVTATNSGGSITAALSIEVKDVTPSALSYTTPNVFTKGTLITSLSPTVTGTVTGYSISPSLPTGLAISATTGVISGTPSVVSAATNYTVTATNSGGSITAALSIEVKDVTPSALSYTTPNVFTKGTLITSLSPTVTGTVTGYSISPSLPTGLAISATTGVISGTPSVVSAATNYTVTATNSGGSITAALSIEVKSGDITISDLSAPSAGCEASELSLSYNVLSGTPTQYQMHFDSQALLAGLSNQAYTILPSSDEGIITFSIPKGMRAGFYTGHLQLKDNFGTISQAYPFEFEVNLSSDFIITKFDNIIACDNSSSRFVSYQWYKNGEAITGATKQFYVDPSGLVGTYVLKVLTVDGISLYSCPKTFNIAKKFVKVYPNPVQANRNFIVQMVGFETNELQNATMTLYDVKGVSVYKTSIVTSLKTLKLPSDQTYVGHLTTSNGDDYTFKIIVNK